MWGALYLEPLILLLSFVTGLLVFCNYIMGSTLLQKLPQNIKIVYILSRSY